MPFVFRDEAHMRKVIDGPIGDMILKKITDSNVKLVALGWMDGGTRNLYTKKPIHNMEDLKGVKMRMMGNPLFVDTMNAMGGNGISMGMNELYSALQTGVVDGAENNPPTYFTQNHYQVAKFYNLTGHLIIPEIFVFSKVSWDKLSKDDQALIRKLSKEASLEQRKLWDEARGRQRRQAQGRRGRIRGGRQEDLLRRHRAGARQVRRAVHRPDQADRSGQVVPFAIGPPPGPRAGPPGAFETGERGSHEGNRLARAGPALPGVHLDRRLVDVRHDAGHSLGRVCPLRHGPGLAVAGAPGRHLLMIVFTFAGGAAAYRAGAHIAVTMLTDRAGPKLGPVLAWMADLLMAAICLFVIVSGLQLCSVTWNQTVPEFPWLRSA